MNVIQSGGRGSANNGRNMLMLVLVAMADKQRVMKAIVSKMVKTIIGGQWKQGEAAAVDT